MDLHGYVRLLLHVSDAEVDLVTLFLVESVKLLEHVISAVIAILVILRCQSLLHTASCRVFDYLYRFDSFGRARDEQSCTQYERADVGWCYGAHAKKGQKQAQRLHPISVIFAVFKKAKHAAKVKLSNYIISIPSN